MPSPFPGMDPFLEHPAHFPGLHDSLIVYMRETLQSRLPEPYYAETGDRVWVEVSKRQLGPDVKVLRPNEETPAGDGTGGLALATAAETRTKPVVIHVPHDEHREVFLNIFTNLDGNERLVTSIEVLSRANKTPGEHGRDLYLKKQQEILDSKINLVEIDLLRGGIHSTAVPLDRALEKIGPFDYHVCLHQCDRWEDYFVYHFMLEDSLPEIAIPLLPGDRPIAVDLQTLFERCYDTGPYRRRVRYQNNATIPPLQPEQGQWATRVLQEKGILPKQ
jgi:hypothetical protein